MACLLKYCTLQLTLNMATAHACLRSQVPRKAADLQRYGKQLLSQLAPDEEAGWDKVKLDIKHWPDQVKLRKRDGVKYIQQVLARADILDGLHLEGQPRFTSSGDLTYCEVWESDAFLQAQEAVRQQHGRDAKVLGLQVSTLCAVTAHNSQGEDVATHAVTVELQPASRTGTAVAIMLY